MSFRPHTEQERERKREVCWGRGVSIRACAMQGPAIGAVQLNKKKMASCQLSSYQRQGGGSGAQCTKYTTPKLTAALPFFKKVSVTPSLTLPLKTGPCLYHPRRNQRAPPKPQSSRERFKLSKKSNLGIGRINLLARLISAGNYLGYMDIRLNTTAITMVGLVLVNTDVVNVWL